MDGLQIMVDQMKDAFTAKVGAVDTLDVDWFAPTREFEVRVKTKDDNWYIGRAPLDMDKSAYEMVLAADNFRAMTPDEVEAYLAPPPEPEPVEVCKHCGQEIA